VAIPFLFSFLFSSVFSVFFSFLTTIKFSVISVVNFVFSFLNPFSILIFDFYILAALPRYEFESNSVSLILLLILQYPNTKIFKD